jgi:hypothetical protein
MADWFEQNAPSAAPNGTPPPPGGDWFAQNAPTTPTLPSADAPVGDFTQGAVTGPLSTLLGAYHVIRQVPGLEGLPEPSDFLQKLATAPNTTAGHAGRFAEQGAEYLVPDTLVGRALKGSGTLINMAAHGLVGAGVAGAQSGGDPATMAESGAIGAGSVPVGNALEWMGSKLLPQILGKTTGTGDALARARNNPTPELIDALRGKIPQQQVVQNFIDGAEQVKNARSLEYRAKLAQIPNTTTLNITPIRKTFNDSLQKFGVGVSTNPQGQMVLDFSRSTLTDPAAQNRVVQMANDLQEWGSQPGDLNPLGMDTLKRRIDDTYSQSSSARAITQSTKNAIRDALNTQVPGYADMTKGYATSSAFLDDLRRELNVDPLRPNFGATPSTATNKILNMMKQNTGYRQVLADQLGMHVGSDLVGQVAGSSLNKMVPQGMAGILDGAGLLTAVATGHLTPAVVAGAAASSPRLMGELMVAMAKAGTLGKIAMQGATSAAQAGTSAQYRPPGISAILAPDVKPRVNPFR